MNSSDIPDGYEPYEVGAAKNIVMCELEDVVAEANEASYEGCYDAILLADLIVEKLIAAGVVFPEGIVDPLDHEELSDGE